MDNGVAIGWLFCCIALYFVPALAARYLRNPNTTSILLLNLLLGWTVIGWVVALVWAFISRSGDADEGALVACPYCAEHVRSEAIKCKHCGSELTPHTKQASAHAATPNAPTSILRKIYDTARR